MHPLLALLTDAAHGKFPPVDGAVTVMPPLAGGWECSVAFTGHAVVATASSAQDVLAEGPDGYGGSMSPDFLRWLSGPNGFVGVIDVMLVRRGTGKSTLPIRTDLDDHPRVTYARQYRSGVVVHGDERGLVTIGAGLAGRREMSIEASEHNRGFGASLIAEAVGLVPEGELLFAAYRPAMQDRSGLFWATVSCRSAAKCLSVQPDQAFGLGSCPSIPFLAAPFGPRRASCCSSALNQYLVSSPKGRPSSSQRW